MAHYAYGDAPKDAMGYSDDEEKKKTKEEEEQKIPKAPRVPRPKLTTEVLKGENGFPDVFHNFPRVFRANFKGKGHEISDLERLLEMYSRWQKRIFPHCDFDDFVRRLEKLSGSNILKTELQQLRQDLVKLVDNGLDDDGADDPLAVRNDGDEDDGHGHFDHNGEGDSEEEDVRIRDHGKASVEQHQPPAKTVGGGAGDYDDDDDDDDEELIRMQAGAQYEAGMDVLDDLEFPEPGGAGRPAPAAAGKPPHAAPLQSAASREGGHSAKPPASRQVPEADSLDGAYLDDILDDAELLDLVDGGPGSTDRPAAGAIDDDELMHLAGVLPTAVGGSSENMLELKLTHLQTERQQEVGLSRLHPGSGGVGNGGGGDGDELNDEELLDLMDEDEAAGEPTQGNGDAGGGGGKRGRGMRLDDEDEE